MRPLTPRRRSCLLAIPFPLTAVALLTVAPPVRAQPSALTDSTSYVDPATGTTVRITQGERCERINLVRHALAGIDGGEKVLLTGSERPILITFDQLKLMARQLVKDGAIDPAEESGWITDRMKTSREEVQPVRDLLTALEGEWLSSAPCGNEPPTAPSSPAAFRGGLKGSWEITCLRGEGKLEFKDGGVWYLEFAGDGTVSGRFENYQGTPRPANGTIKDNGLAQGEAVTIRWSGTFERVGNSLALTGGQGSLNYTEAVLNSEAGLTCNPGSWRKD